MVSTGAVIARQAGRTVVDVPLPTDLDQFWDYWQGTVLPRVREFILAETGGAPAPDDQPFFAALDIEVWCSEPDEALGLREERDSPAEALHEDLYFATLDYIEALGTGHGWSGTLGGGTGPAALDAPGAIRPFVHVRPGHAPAARVTLRRRLRHLAEFVPAGGGERVPLGHVPDGPRPRAAFAWVRCGVGAPGFTALGLNLAGAAARAGDVLRAALPPADPSDDALVLNIAMQGGAPVTTTLPLSALTCAARATGRRPDFRAVLDEERVRPALAWLAMLPGISVRQAGRSFGGRAIAAIEVTAPLPGVVWSRKKQSLHKPTLLVVARHHANEPASTPAALALAERCATHPAYRLILRRVNLVVIPIENPDGAALHGLLALEHPTWKLHAARYNAAGYEFARDFFNPATPWGEARVRPALWYAWAPDVVVDNHGVPSHEWNQIFDGFGSPPRFGVSYWMVPALLYGILRYPPGDPMHHDFAVAVRERITAAVAADPALLAANQLLRERYERWGHAHAPERFPAEYQRDMLWYFGALAPEAQARSRQPANYYRVTTANLVTEVADETAQGDYLALVAHGHLVANQALLRLLAEAAAPVERAVTREVAGLRLILRRRRPLAAPGMPPR